MLTTESTAEEVFPLYEGYAKDLRADISASGMRSNMGGCLSSEEFAVVWKRSNKAVRHDWIKRLNDGYKNTINKERDKYRAVLTASR